MIPGPNILNIGEPGTGKSFSLKSLVDYGLKVFVVQTEQGVYPTQIRRHYIQPFVPVWDEMITFATRINTMSIDTQASSRDPNQASYRQFIEVLKCLANFKDDLTGEEFGPVDTWGPERVLALDSLTGINSMVLKLVTGGRAIRSFPEWNVAQAEEEKLIDAITNLPCTVIINTHPEVEKDEVTGRMRIFASALGRKLAPTLGRKFDEVLHSRRGGKTFSWDNISADVATKFRLLPPNAGHPQNYAPLLAAWEKAGGKFTDMWDGSIPTLPTVQE